MSNTDQSLQVFHKPADLMGYLQKGAGAVKMALPKHLNPDRMLRLAVTCFSTTPALRQCTGQSILSSIVVASQIGLEPGVAGQGYLIPYKQTCTFVPGWQGLVGLLNNSGRATAWTGAVFEGDEWDFQLGSRPVCRHVPGPNFGDPEKMRWVYACGKVNGSEQPIVEAWPVERVWKHRDRFNKVGAKHYSYQHPEMYARKVVLLQVLKYMPRSIELNNAIVASDAAEIGRTTRVEEGVIIEVESQVEEGPTQPIFASAKAGTSQESLPQATGSSGVQQGLSGNLNASQGEADGAGLQERDKLLITLEELLEASDVSQQSLQDWARANKHIAADQTLADARDVKLKLFVDKWSTIRTQIKPQ